MNTAHDLFHKTDYGLLQKQRLSLGMVMHKYANILTEEEFEHLAGIESLLDGFNDVALDDFAFPEYKVYPDHEYLIKGPFEDYAGQVVKIVGTNGPDINDDVWEVKSEDGKQWFVEGEKLERVED